MSRAAGHSLRVAAVLVVAALAAATCIWRASPSQGAAQPTARPNIVFVLVDDMDAELLDHLPRLRSLLVDEGTSFDNFFLNVSLCCPSRTSILRGQYGQNTTILTNQPPDGGFERVYELGLENSTVATWLQGAGYRTVLLGKYLNGYPDTAPSNYVPPGWTEWYSPSAGNPYSEYNYTLNENGRAVRYGRTPDDYLTDVLSRHADDFIRRSAADGQPFFMYVAPYAPHAPYTPAPHYADAFPGVQVPRPPSFNEADVSDKPEWIRGRPQLTAQQVQQLDRAYRLRLQSLLAVEDLVDRLVQTLRQTGELENTYIVFTSDNGYHLGQHRLGQGKQAPYEEDIRVPLIVRGPGVPRGRTLDSITGNVDLAPTFAALAGVTAPAFVDGRSLVPLLGVTPPPASDWRRAYPLEHAGPQGSGRTTTAARPGGVQEPPDPGDQPIGGRNPRAEPGFTGLRTARHTYVEYDTGEVELYDLQADPYQLQNIAATADPALLAQLHAWLAALRTCSGAGCRVADAAPPR